MYGLQTTCFCYFDVQLMFVMRMSCLDDQLLYATQKSVILLMGSLISLDALVVFIALHHRLDMGFVQTWFIPCFNIMLCLRNAVQIFYLSKGQYTHIHSDSVKWSVLCCLFIVPSMCARICKNILSFSHRPLLIYFLHPVFLSLSGYFTFLLKLLSVR